MVAPWYLFVEVGYALYHTSLRGSGRQYDYADGDTGGCEYTSAPKGLAKEQRTDQGSDNHAGFT